MKPLIPSDATSTELGADANPDREDQSLHDEILTRLRDHIVEGNIPDGDRMPERQLCEMLGISRTPLREALKVLARYCATGAPACGNGASTTLPNCSTSWAGSKLSPGGLPAKTSPTPGS